MPQKFFKKYFISTAFGAGIGIVSSAVLVFLMAAAIVVGNIPAMVISPITVIFLAFGGFVGGFAAARFAKEKGFLCGAFSGIIFFITVWCSGAFFENFGFGTEAVFKALMIIIASSLGGIIGVNYIKRK